MALMAIRSVRRLNVVDNNNFLRFCFFYITSGIHRSSSDGRASKPKYSNCILTRFPFLGLAGAICKETIASRLSFMHAAPPNSHFCVGTACSKAHSIDAITHDVVLPLQILRQPWTTSRISGPVCLVSIKCQDQNPDLKV